MPRLYKGSELKYNTGVKVPDGTIKDIRLTFYTDDKASFVKTYSKDEIEVIDGCLSCSIDKKDTLLLNEGVLNCKMESSVVRDDFPDTYDTVFSFNTPYYLKDTLNPEEIKYQEKTITSNGTYTADDGYVALSKVDVDIPEKQLQQKTIIQNGEVLPDSGYDGFSKITVDFTINIANGIKFGGSNFTKIPFKLVCDGSVTNLIGIFQNCTSLKSVDVDN